MKSSHPIRGMPIKRKQIDQVWAGVRDRRWELIICEDVGRLFRHETIRGQLIETAVDLRTGR